MPDFEPLIKHWHTPKHPLEEDKHPNMHARTHPHPHRQNITFIK